METNNNTNNTNNTNNSNNSNNSIYNDKIVDSMNQNNGSMNQNNGSMNQNNGSMNQDGNNKCPPCPICESKNEEEKVKKIGFLQKFFSFGDNVETSIYTDQNWYLQEIHGFFTCVKPSKLCNEFNYNILGNLINFSSDLNKTSLKNINKKNRG